MTSWSTLITALDTADRQGLDIPSANYPRKSLVFG